MRGLVHKKGASHFEMIISFVFFIGFVFFLFIFLQPHDTSMLSGAVTTGLYDSFEEYAHTNLSNMFLKTNYTGTSSCFYIQLPKEDFIYVITDGNSYVTKLSGTDVNSSLDGNDLNIEEGESFFRVAISPEFDDDDITDCDSLSDYELGPPIERRVLSYSALEEMSERYFNNYEELKSDLRVPPIFDFAIVSENLPIKMEPQNGVPDSIDIMVQDYMIGVLKSDGTLINDRFSLKIW
ncbi:MAG: hypothetical protein ABIF18_01730 [archaeon]